MGPAAGGSAASASREPPNSAPPEMQWTEALRGDPDTRHAEVHSTPRLLALGAVLLCFALYGSYTSYGSSWALPTIRSPLEAPREGRAQRSLRRGRWQYTRASEVAALKEFRKSVKDPLNVLSSWSGTDPCTFLGVHCEPAAVVRAVSGIRGKLPSGVVAGLDLNGFGLGGSISPSIANLRFLGFLHLSHNNFVGVLPNLSPLQLLNELDVSANALGGPFPRSILALGSLKYLDLRFNAFSGQVPPQLFTMKLDVLAINNNQFTAGSGLWQTLPQSSASVIVAGNNPLGGVLPNNLSPLGDSLQEVCLRNASLEGTIPPTMGALNETTVIDLSHNELTGGVPATFQNLDNLVKLNLASNFLEQDIAGLRPLLTLPRVQNVTISDNFFTGTAGSMVSGSPVLHASQNCVENLPNQKDAPVCNSVTNIAQRTHSSGLL